MGLYIKKSDIVAEIERIKKEECPVDSYEGRCKLLWFEQFLSFLNTLEVKEVDLGEDEPVSNDLEEAANDLEDYAYQVAYDLSRDWLKENATWDDVETAVKLGAQWQKQQLIDKACEWINLHIGELSDIYTRSAIRNEFLEDFRKAMEERL